MDIGAYSQIEELQYILDANGITIPRLRGLRLMKDEEAHSLASIKNRAYDAVCFSYEDTLTSYPIGSLNPEWSETSDRTKRRLKRCTVYKHYRVMDVKWNKVHGKLRKAMKYHAKRAEARMTNSMLLWNTYAGRDDVIYIHAKLGSTNWSGTTWKNLAREPWFLDGEDDPWDSVYCNIYAKI